MTERVRVLFVCLGNICRSPSAEGVFRALVEESGLEDRIEIDSCGTGHWHIGKAPDARATQAARKRGIDISTLRARQFVADDLEVFDYVLVMDQQNLSDVTDVWHRIGGTRPALFLSYGQSSHQEVPDPYYGGAEGFEFVLDLIHEAGEGLLAEIRERLA
ncbi:low molecular weight protein-tyrosine-phosphatase [Marinobacter sp. M216]|uniref:protein-tyrosine-phosphatase n=1 Tax=Marinobacter albus TaxID=3030833 RepID=A0ABT7HB44_9GAMM|nr:MULTISPECIES: low molecular weight protein-tyrosine-phosphatase [unclassified Marinobacter]MBW7470140.1 low molecular weight phosphotyrosine protein phosphatase [Marinobacter sp. F4218]MDK9557596.1 low molecular weight protein-tyrosine-phosphatase [Marinobacter sp. M216]